MTHIDAGDLGTGDMSTITITDAFDRPRPQDICVMGFVIKRCGNQTPVMPMDGATPRQKLAE